MFFLARSRSCLYHPDCYDLGPISVETHRIRETCAHVEDIFGQHQPSRPRIRKSSRCRPTLGGVFDQRRPNSPGGRPKLAQIRPRHQILTRAGQTWPRIDQLGLASTKFGMMSTRFGTNSAKVGPTSTRVNQIWPGIGRDWSEFDQTCAERFRSWPQSSNMWPEVCQIQPAR